MSERDDAFMKYAEDFEKAQSQKNKGGFRTERNLDTIKWVGCEQNTPVIFRAVGSFPANTDRENTAQAKIVNVAWVTDDNGKQFKLVRPNLNEDPDYIINKIIRRVTSPSWVKNTKVYKVKEAFPEIFNMVEKNGLSPADKRYNYDKGWKGKEVLIMNVIDRADMEWHRENKHTKLLAKGITVTDDNEFVDEGISSYSTLPRFVHLFKSYGSWERYDIGITRTGSKDTPYIIVNASNSPKEISPSYLQEYISTADDLTDEEKSWATYDIDKIYGNTSATKILNRIGAKIKKIDIALNTSYYEELISLSEKEKAMWEEMYGDKDNTPSAPQEPQVVTRTAPTREIVKEQTTVEQLPYISRLSADLQSKVKSARRVDGNNWDIKWDVEEEQLAACPYCGTIAPYEATSCPACGTNFS